MIDSATLFKIALLLVAVYVASKIVLYVIKFFRGKGRIEIATGQINLIRAVARRCVQFQLVGDPRIFEMYSDENWVLYKNDQVRVAGYQDQTGKFMALAYENLSKSVIGNAEVVHLPWLIAIASIYAMGGMIYLRLYDYFLIALAVLIYGLIIVQPDIDVRRSIYLLSK